MDYNALGKRIREVRTMHNFTQLQVAEQLHFSQKHFGNIERGNAHPSLECLVCIANVLNVPIDYLLQDSLISYEDYFAYELVATVDQYLENLEQQKIIIKNLQKKMNLSKNFTPFSI